MSRSGRAAAAPMLLAALLAAAAVLLSPHAATAVSAADASADADLPPCLSISERFVAFEPVLGWGGVPGGGLANQVLGIAGGLQVARALGGLPVAAPCSAYARAHWRARAPRAQGFARGGTKKRAGEGGPGQNRTVDTVIFSHVWSVVKPI